MAPPPSHGFRVFLATGFVYLFTGLGPPAARRSRYKDGTTWLVDEGVVCPGTRRLLATGTDRTPGRAAAVYSTIKPAKYSDQNNLVPVIVVEQGVAQVCVLAAIRRRRRAPSAHPVVPSE